MHGLQVEIRGAGQRSVAEPMECEQRCLDAFPRLGVKKNSPEDTSCATQDATDQQRFGFGPCDRVSVALLVELGLHRVKEITIEDGGLLAGEDLALEGDLADVEPVAQKMGERAAGG